MTVKDIIRQAIVIGNAYGKNADDMTDEILNALKFYKYAIVKTSDGNSIGVKV